MLKTKDLRRLKMAVKIKYIFTTIIIAALGITCLLYYAVTYPHQHISRQTAIKYFESLLSG